MKTFQMTCNVTEGYDFHRDVLPTVGHITTMNIAGTELLPDQTRCVNPLDSSHVAAVAVLRTVYGVTGAAGSIMFQGQISPTNRQLVEALIMNQGAELPVSFTFDAYEYDFLAKKYFKAATSFGTTMNGAVEQTAGPALSVQSEPAREVSRH